MVARTYRIVFNPYCLSACAGEVGKYIPCPPGHCKSQSNLVVHPKAGGKEDSVPDSPKPLQDILCLV